MWIALIAAAGLAGAGVWLMRTPAPAESPGEPAAAETPSEPRAEATAPANEPAHTPPPPASVPATADAVPEGAASAAGSAQPPVPSAQPAPSASAEAMRVVVVKAKPPQAKFYRKGKEVSGSPMTVELPPGEKRAYEVGLPGYVTRRLVVDGSKSEISVGLRPETPAGGAPTPAAPTAP
jgi:hypothetical protein